MRQVDSHLHLWNLERVHYHWLTTEQPNLYRNVLPDEVYPMMRAAGIDAAVVVEAANTTAEIPYLVELARQHEWIAGVVGWMSADDQIDAKPYLELRGVRLPAIDGSEIPMLPERVAEAGLVCDLNVSPDGYPQALKLIEAHPERTFVLGHFAGAAITPDGAGEWAARVRPFAELPNVVMKAAGYLTAAQPKPLEASTLRGYVAAAVDVFGAGRLMYGSDYPICTQAGSYAQTVTLLRDAIAHLSADEQALIMGGTATRVYGLV